ncbi:MAG: hypothetical protein IPI34_10780 [bacterium]|nr:hypothetical protein [bacterium]
MLTAMIRGISPPYGVLPAAALLALGLAAAGPAAAATGSAVSAPDTLDSRPPLVAALSPAGGETLQAADQETLRWSVDESSWGAAPAAITVTVFDGAEVLAQALVPPDPDGTYAWVWTVPDQATTAAVLAVEATDRFGWIGADQGEAFTIEGSSTPAPPTPTVDRLGPVHPNPFNPGTTVAFNLRAAAEIRLTVFDVRGREMATLAQGDRPAGRHAAAWDGRGPDGRAAPSGTYFARLSVRGADRRDELTARLTLVK